MPQIQVIPDFFEDNSLSILRLDLPDPVSGGNKIYKLKYNLEEMGRLGLKKLLTFGGAFSNHIAAVATAGRERNFETVGIIRGDELTEISNAVLDYASSCGMKLIFISREDYRKRNDPVFQKNLLVQYGPAYLLPEGGSNEFAVKGCKEILSAETEKYDQLICPVGTGATLAGIISSAKKHQEIIGLAVLNGKDYLEKEVENYLAKETVVAKWKIEHDFTLGGYGKSNPELKNFIAEMKTRYELPLDEIYSGKTLFAIRQMKKNDFLRGKNHLFVHTGGYAFTADARFPA
ncbi:MAG TPA: pyridoxal-phosphate dependent enzyme [Bacteroidia bacterium]|nr:pyridoxal-phosphate dependent enzyme [Bacteroidia bacterium]